MAKEPGDSSILDAMTGKILAPHPSTLPQGVGGKPQPLSKANASSSTDPKSAALANLGINLGNKNLRTLRREEVDNAFTHVFTLSVPMADNALPPHASKLGSKRQYQRILLESHQYLLRFLHDSHQSSHNSSNNGGGEKSHSAKNSRGSIRSAKQSPADQKSTKKRTR